MGAGGVSSRNGVRGYNPRGNFDICDARMCILECRIGIVYGDDNMAVVGFVVETGGEKEYEWTIFAFLAGNRLYIPTAARGYGRTLLSSPSRSGRSPAAKRFVCAF